MRGSCGSVSWLLLPLPARLIVMWSVPFNLNLHDSCYSVWLLRQKTSRHQLARLTGCVSGLGGAAAGSPRCTGARAGPAAPHPAAAGWFSTHPTSGDSHILLSVIFEKFTYSAFKKKSFKDFILYNVHSSDFKDQSADDCKISNDFCKQFIFEITAVELFLYYLQGNKADFNA